MKKVSETYHLIRRNSIWYYQRRVPSELTHIFGTVIKKSLGTEKKSEAKKLRTLRDLEADAAFEKARLSLAQGETSGSVAALSIDDILHYLRQAVIIRDTKAAKAFASDGSLTGLELDELREDAETELQILGNPDDPRRQQTSRAFVIGVLKSGNLTSLGDISEEAEEYGRRALVELCRRRIDRYDDRHDRPWYDIMFSPKAPSPSFGKVAKEFLVVVAEEHGINEVGKQRQDKVASFVKVLVEIVGESFPVAELDDAKVQDVRSVLSRLPANRTKIYGDFPLAEAVKRASQDKAASISATTQADYLRTFKAITRFAVRRKYLASDPAHDATPMKKATALDVRRLPLTPSQLSAFFTSDFYQRCANGAPQPYDGADRVWRFWFPLLMLFSGARPNELAQLSVGDVQKTSKGTIFLNLVPDDTADSMQLKTVSSRRRIPVHQEILKMGFIQFVEERRQAGGDSATLFGPFKPNRFGNLAWYPLRRLNVYLRESIGESKKQSIYSLRHNVRDALRVVGAPPDALGAIAGWSDGGKSTSDNYGDPSNPDLYVKWVNSIAYPGLDLSFLHV